MGDTSTQLDDSCQRNLEYYQKKLNRLEIKLHRSASENSLLLETLDELQFGHEKAVKEYETKISELEKTVEEAFTQVEYYKELYISNLSGKDISLSLTRSLQSNSKAHKEALASFNITIKAYEDKLEECLNYIQASEDNYDQRLKSKEEEIKLLKENIDSLTITNSRMSMTCRVLKESNINYLRTIRDSTKFKANTDRNIRKIELDLYDLNSKYRKVLQTSYETSDLHSVRSELDYLAKEIEDKSRDLQTITRSTQQLVRKALLI